MIRRNILKIITLFSVLIMAMLLVIINDYRDRMIETKYYENAFLIYFNEGPWGIETRSEYDDFQSKLERIDDYKVVVNNIDTVSVSDCVGDYIKCVLLMNSVSYEDTVKNYFRYGNIEFRHKGGVIGRLKWPEFTKASLSEFNKTLKMDDLCEILEDKFDHASEDLYEYWFINKYEDMDTILPGGIRFIYKSPEKRVIEKKHFTKVKILNPIYNIDLFSRKKKYNNIKMKVYLENSDKTHEFTLVYIYGRYDLSKFFYEVYGGYPYEYNGWIRMYSPMEEKYEEESINLAVRDAYGYYGFSPDAVHNACIGNYDVATFNTSFKTKLRKEGFLNNLKIKDTKKIDDGSIYASSKELRELTLDDDNETKIMCLFKIIHPDTEEGYDYEGGGPEEVGDILTYIIPEDKMNLSYEEMYQLAFNDDKSNEETLNEEIVEPKNQIMHYGKIFIFVFAIIVLSVAIIVYRKR